MKFKIVERSISLPSSFVKGKIGENKVRLDLYRLPENEYLILHDVMLRNDNNVTAQIDHLIFSKYGIFVIETKNYSGFITGESKDNKWIRYVGENMDYINNPVHQNNTHVRFLKRLLNLSEDVFIPLVCIYGNCKLEVDWDKTVKFKYLVDRIGFFKEIKLLNYREIYEKVKEMNIQDNIVKRQHVIDKKLQFEFKYQQSENKCPKCGGNLKKRNGKYGDFYGCSNYPNCEYTQDIK